MSDPHRAAGGRVPAGQPGHQAQAAGPGPRPDQLLRVNCKNNPEKVQGKSD